jgi:hypothetical protein
LPQRLEQQVAQPSSLVDAPQQTSVAQVEPVVEDEALEGENETAVAILCKGICLPTLTSILLSNPSLIMDQYLIFPAGCIRHNKCRIYIPEDDIILGRTSCQICFNVRKHVRKDRDPILFAALGDDVQSQIAPPKSRIENALKMKYQNASMGFAEDSEMSWLCMMFHISYPKVPSIILAKETETSLYFCQYCFGS